MRKNKLVDKELYSDWSSALKEIHIKTYTLRSTVFCLGGGELAYGERMFVKESREIRRRVF